MTQDLSLPLAPDLPASALEALAPRAYRDAELGDAVARHPNTPRETVIRFIRRYPQAVLENPALPLYALEDPGWLERIPEHLLGKLARQPQASPTFISWLLASPATSPRLAACRCPALTRQQLEQLLRDPEPSVRARVAKNPGLTAEDVALLARDSRQEVRSVVADHAELEPVLVERLVADRAEGVRRSVSRRRELTQEQLECLVHDDAVSVRVAVLKSQRELPPHLIDVLFETAHSERQVYRLALARHSCTPEPYRAVLREMGRGPFPPQETASQVAAKLRSGKLDRRGLQRAASLPGREIMQAMKHAPLLPVSVVLAHGDDYAIRKEWLALPGGPR